MDAECDGGLGEIPTLRQNRAEGWGNPNSERVGQPPIIRLKPGSIAKLTVVRAGAPQEIAVEVWDRATVKWDGKTLSRPTSAPIDQ